MAINIRDYQAELIAAVRQEMRQHNSVVMQSPTGSGKTLTTAWIVDSVRKKEKRCQFLCSGDCFPLSDFTSISYD